MAILGFLAAAVGAILVWYWRFKMAREAADDLSDLAGDVRAAFRRYGFTRSRNRHPAETLDDPRLAAATMMVAIAKLDGALTQSQLDAVTRETLSAFQVDPREAADMVAYARWLSDQSHDPDDSARRLAPLIRDRAPAEAHLDLLTRMERVAAAEGGGATEAQRLMLKRLADKLGVERKL